MNGMNITKQNLTVALVAFATVFTTSLSHAEESSEELSLPELQSESGELRESLDNWAEDALSDISVVDATSKIINNLKITHFEPSKLIEVVTTTEPVPDVLPEKRKS